MEYKDEMYLMEHYGLTEYTRKKMEFLVDILKDNITQANSAWNIIIGQSQKKEEVYAVEDESARNDKEDDKHVCLESTQFYFTQVDRTVIARQNASSYVHNNDIIECLYEGLECVNGNLDLAQLENLSDEDLVHVISALQSRLKAIGTYNLCCSMNSMDLEKRMKYSAILYSYFLLPKIIAMKEPSRLLSSAMRESVQKFPDDIHKLIFVPLLTADLQDTTIVNVISSNFEPQRKPMLITDFLMTVEELKAWHVPILQNLLSLKVDCNTKDKVLQLFAVSSLAFAKDKNFGKLLLSFIKANSNFTEQQKELLWEIINVNGTFFKKPMENILKSL